MILEEEAGKTKALPALKMMSIGAQQVRLLPGQEGFVFRMYGVPDELDKLN
ncbi:hypothetical protein N9Z85_05535 [Akkermansiaceae bacterium]|nr:hypothetical protein [Akkermansiaceae bacterium]